MEDTQHVIIDSKVNQIIRSYKENDQLFYTYGVDNIIFGMIKSENFSYDTFSSVMPVGVYINGVIAVYNENTYEDFETVLNDEIEKIKKEITHSENDDIKYIALAVKEVLYLDDYETMEFEYKKYGDNTEIEVKYVENAIEELYKSYYVLKHRTHIGKGIECPKDIQSLMKDGLVINIIDDKQNLMVDNVGNLSEENAQHITKFIEKIDLSSLKEEELKCINIQLGSKPGDLFNEISMSEIVINDMDKNDIVIDVIGIINKKNNNYNKILSTMFSKLISSLNQFADSAKGTTLSQSIAIYNPLFTSLPLLVTSNTDFTKEDNKISLKVQSSNKEAEILRTFYHIKGLSLFNLNPLTLPLYQSKHLISPHLIINKPLSSDYIVRSCVKGKYEYFHYNHDSINDAGWGCAYRSLQTVFSWFLLNTDLAKGKAVPSIKDIQTTLVKLGDKDKSLIGSTDWIGAVEVNLVLNELLGVESKIVYVPSGSELASKGRELAYHFEHTGCPIMIGGGKFAYTILGVDYDRVKGECMFLILDPHYGGEDDNKTLCNKGWCNWKTIALFEKENFYNMCIPVIP